MSGPWRIIVDSWISDEANWYGRRSYVVSGPNSLAAALRSLAAEGPLTLLDEDRMELCSGTAPPVDVPSEPKPRKQGPRDPSHVSPT